MKGMQKWWFGMGLAMLVALMAGCGGGGGGGGGKNSGGGGNPTGGGSTGGGSPDHGLNGGGGSGDVKKWTYMVYMGGDNNLSSAGLTDLNEMESVGSTNDVNVVLQAEFSTKYTDFGGSYQGQTLRMKVANDQNPNGIDFSPATDIGQVDMASPAALTDFIRWATHEYPAEHYALVIWDHGAGWKTSRLRSVAARGAVQDETSGGFMTLPQLASGVRDAGVKLDIINFDACLMAMYEVAYEFKGLVDYMVFSEEVEPGDGDPYDTILSGLTSTPSMSAADLSKLIVDKFQAFYASSGRGEATTKSAVDMTQIDNLHQQMKGLASAISSEYDAVGSVVAAALGNTVAYEYPENHDLYDFAQYLNTNLVSGGATKNAAQAVMSAVENAVIATKTTGDNMANSRGLAVYLPSRNQVSADSSRNDLLEYQKLASNMPAEGSWYSAVQTITENSTTSVLNTGGFAFYLQWDTDADLDLFVWEPCQPQNDSDCGETIHAPYMGQTTPNGYFSGDSSATGLSQEYYVANEYVEAGDYDVLINYYEDGSYNYANAQLWYIDPSKGVNDWVMVGNPVQLDLSNPYPGSGLDLSQIGNYSDWWYPGRTTRVIQNGQVVRLAAGERNITLHIQRKKGRPNLVGAKP